MASLGDRSFVFSGKSSDSEGSEAALFEIMKTSIDSEHVSGLKFIKQLEDSSVSQYTVIPLQSLNGFLTIGGANDSAHMLDTCSFVSLDSTKTDLEIPKSKYLRKQACSAVFGDHATSNKIYVYIFGGTKT